MTTIVTCNCGNVTQLRRGRGEQHCPRCGAQIVHEYAPGHHNVIGYAQSFADPPNGPFYDIGEAYGDPIDPLAHLGPTENRVVCVNNVRAWGKASYQRPDGTRVYSGDATITITDCKTYEVRRPWWQRLGHRLRLWWARR